MSSDQAAHDTPARQETHAGRDAYIANEQYFFNFGVSVREPKGLAARRQIWGNVPARNPGFTGREEALGAVREALVHGDRAVVQALHGMGGVGKTQIAIEYAHRFASEYDVVWWIAAEQAGLIGDQFAALAAELKCAEPGLTLAAMRRAVLMALREHERALLVLDNAEKPEDVAEWLPGGSGHVLITSRIPGWNELAIPVEVNILQRSESVDLLQSRMQSLAKTDAARIAEAMGDLPLGIVQAAGYMAETCMAAAEYISLLDNRAAEILDRGRPTSYPLSLAAATLLSLEKLRNQEPLAADLAVICAFLAPDPILANWFANAVKPLPAFLSERASDPLAWAKIVDQLGRSALIRIDPAGLLMHRLTQAIIRSHLEHAEAAATRELAEAVLVANDPGNPVPPSNWPKWTSILPHVLAVDPASSENTALREIAVNAAWYRMRRGDARSGHDLAQHLYDHWRDRLGLDDPHTLWAANNLGQACRDMGNYAKARQLDADALVRRRRLFGNDYPRTLASASNLAIDLSGLGELKAARELDEDTLARRQRVLGEDHCDTLASARNLARILHMMGKYQEARELDEGTLERSRRVLGEDDPETLATALNLAYHLYMLGNSPAARAICENTFAKFCQVLGKDHPYTLMAANDLAEILRSLREYREAQDLDMDTLERRRRLLGEDSNLTRESVLNLAEDMRLLGEA